MTFHLTTFHAVSRMLMLFLLSLISETRPPASATGFPPSGFTHRAAASRPSRAAGAKQVPHALEGHVTDGPETTLHRRPRPGPDLRERVVRPLRHHPKNRIQVDRSIPDQGARRARRAIAMSFRLSARQPA